MPQNPLAATVAVESGVQKPINLDNFGGLRTSNSATSSALDISTATVVKASAGRVIRVSVITAGTAAGTVNDVATTGGVAASNEIAAIPAAVGILELEWPCANGITVTPGSGQVISVSYI